METTVYPHPPNLTRRAGAGRHRSCLRVCSSGLRRPHQSHRQNILTRRDLHSIQPEEPSPQQRRSSGHSNAADVSRAAPEPRSLGAPEPLILGAPEPQIRLQAWARQTCSIYQNDSTHPKPGLGDTANVSHKKEPSISP